ncbi:hypothetical protein CQ018_01035 [Arthrobacter sp. MYb227]|uniref:hypothetical protein n=1 Tax=Arthrobacter sp. MYb227 TaxID=1848601 RepID=UPI000CFAD7D2|nr:hypothetical protein [Arthrobacter sp. MYb227]PQZ95913.1 hypothetical protein CQ018_01035 [Arthrobacter sp. MYb227]
MTLNFVDPSVGTWIVAALEAQGQQDDVADLAAGQIPSGYEAYARVFHPALGLDGEAVRWGKIAKKRGTTMHGAAQFTPISGISEEGIALLDDAWDGEAPGGDGLPAAQLTAMAPLLAANTQTPEEIFLGLWNGLAFIHGGDQIEVLIDQDSELSEEENAARQAAAKAEAKRPAFSDRVRNGPTLHMGSGYRSYYIFQGTAEDLASPLWARTSEGEQRQAPNLAWPHDRAWILSTELYEDSSIIAGSRALIDALIGCPGLEAYEVRIDTRLDLAGDNINPMPEEILVDDDDHGLGDIHDGEFTN